MSTPTQTQWVVEVNEGVVEASRQGVEWWHLFSLRFKDTDRLRYTKQPCVIGGVAEVECGGKEHADWLADEMVVTHGLPKTAVRVKQAAPGGAA